MKVLHVTMSLIKSGHWRKKMLSCMNDTKIEYIPKDNNHIYTMSTAMYELYKLEI